MPAAGATLCLVLGDQLTPDLSSLCTLDPQRDHIWMCEVAEEATYVRHHKKKIAFLFSAMRHFAAELGDQGFNVHYTKLDDADNAGSFTDEVARAVKLLKPSRIVVTFPGEWRVLQDMQTWQDRFGVPVDILPDERFLCAPEEFRNWAKDRKTLRMEYFYRQMRENMNVLMDNGKPAGGQWNYDRDNRKPPDVAAGDMFMSTPLFFEPDAITREVMALVEHRFGDHFGDLEPFHFAVTRDQALQVLEHFIAERLASFGDYQDAMLQGKPWMYHSFISAYLNCGLLSAREVIVRAEHAWRAGWVPLNAAEGFIRQILGWREYVRGIYWMLMPDYADANELNATRPLPWFYWTGETEMNCLKQCITETRQNAYAHHIQRLMVLGNFALLAGIDPRAVNAWYLIVYADAYEWVEMPNVSGMVLYADGGYLASKPYAASGAYIDKMSDYCKGCRYKVAVKNGPEACPFNYLYWDFMVRNRDRLKTNHRLGMVYNTLDKMDPARIADIRKDAKEFLNSPAMDAGDSAKK